jgi:hypothetical protein
MSPGGESVTQVIRGLEFESHRHIIENFNVFRLKQTERAK